jgi:fructose-1,6-bisphosphatase class II
MSTQTARDLSLEFLRVTEAAAIAAARTMGRGDRKGSDQVAVEEMRRVMESVNMDGTIVIGEGERDKAPMLFIGEKVGDRSDGAPKIDIAVDPLEGTNLCATGTPNAIAVMAAAEGGGLLHAPDIYMDKIVVGPSCRGIVDLDAPVEDNLQAIAGVLNRKVSDLVVVVLDRPRHEKLVSDIRRAGARIKLISDGDLSPAITAAVLGSGIHAVMGTGGAPEGVLTAAAMRCLNGEIVGRLKILRASDEARMETMGISDPNRVYKTEELASGKNILFAATGVTSGDLLGGVRFFGDGCRTHSLVMTSQPRGVRFIDTIHVREGDDVKIRF